MKAQSERKWQIYLLSPLWKIVTEMWIGAAESPKS